VALAFLTLRALLLLGGGIVSRVGQPDSCGERAYRQPAQGRQPADAHRGDALDELIERGRIHGRLHSGLRTAVEARHQDGAKSPSSIVL